MFRLASFGDALFKFLDVWAVEKATAVDDFGDRFANFFADFPIASIYIKKRYRGQFGWIADRCRIAGCWSIRRGHGACFRALL
jgi:hypothetical protein